MSATDCMLAVIEAVYDAAVEENLWPEALRKLAEFTASQAATFWVLDGSETPRLPVFTFLNFDPSAVREYLETTVALDPTVQYLVRHPEQPIVHDGLVQITERERARHPYYDWHERRIETRFRLVGQISPAPRIQAGVALHRTARAGRFEPSDVRQFAVLHRHLERALTLAFRLGSLGALQQSTAELLDRNRAAMLLLDRSGRVVYTNAAADRVRAAADGIRFSNSGLTAAARRENGALQDLIADALSAARSPAGAGGILRVSRPSGKRPYVVLVSPLSRNYPALSLLRPTVCVVITDPATAELLPAERLEAAWGLTAAESRLAALLASGAGLREAAARLGITYATARTRLAEIFRKTETRRQGELIRMLLTTLP